MVDGLGRPVHGPWAMARCDHAVWRAIRDAIHLEVCTRGFDSRQGAFVQSYGSKLLDASLLMLPLVGFLPGADPRIRGTVEAIERQLTHRGFVSRYETVPDVDGLPPGEASFLLCSFWLVDNLTLLGRHEDAHRLFERLLSIRNDVGLLAEGVRHPPRPPGRKFSTGVFARRPYQ